MSHVSDERRHTHFVSYASANERRVRALPYGCRRHEVDELARALVEANATGGHT